MILRNVFANLVSNVWGVVSVFLFIPLYIKFLGIEAYGLVGFYATLIGFLSLADMGFTATLKREMARLSVLPNAAIEKRDMLYTYEIIYGGISLFLSLLIWFSAPFIAEHWLHSNVIPQKEVAISIRLMGISIALQLSSGLYIGGLMGLQQQVWANSLNVGIGALRAIGAVLALWLFSPTIFTFFAWQLIANIVYLLLSRLSLWRTISPSTLNSKAYFKWAIIKSTGRFAISMASMSLIGVLLNQTDKLVVGKLTTLTMFSYYSVAAALASLPITLSGAIGSALFPRFTELVALLDSAKLVQVYRRACELIGIIVVPAGLVLVFFSGEFIFAWTGSKLIGEQARLAASFLLIGQLLQSITVIPYNLALAHGSIRFSQKVGLYSIILITPLMVCLTMKFGIEGAGMSWLLLNCITLPINLYFLHQQELAGTQMLKDCLRGAFRPLIYSLPCIILGKWLLPYTYSRLEVVAEMGIVWFVAFVISLVSFPDTRSSFVKEAISLLNRSDNK